MIRHDDNVILDTNVLVHLARRKAAGRYLRGHYRLDHLLLTLDGDFLHLHPDLVRVEHCRPDDLPKGQ